jgi:hypothetical protein
VVPPKGLWRFVITRLLTVAAIALVMVWAISNTKKGMIEAVIFLGAIILIAAVEVPLLQQRWSRLERRRLESLPAGVIYAGPARLEAPKDAPASRPLPGELLVDRRGVSFTAKAAQTPVLNLAWSEISHVSLRPISSAPLAGSLVLTVAGGATHRYVVQRCASLADALVHLPERV